MLQPSHAVAIASIIMLSQMLLKHTACPDCMLCLHLDANSFDAYM